MGAEVRPLGDRVLVRPEPESETRGRIVIPEKYRQKPQEGQVLAVGPAVTTLQPGDRVLYGKFAFLEVSPHGVLLRERDVMAVLS
jgi:chaperonin GroES